MRVRVGSRRMYSSLTSSSQVTMTLRAATAMSTSWNSSPSMMQVPSGAGLLHVDDGGVQLGHGDGDDLLAGVEGVLHLHALQVVHLIQSLALLLADAPVLHQAGALHQAHRQEGQAQGGGVQLEHQHVLGVVLIGQLALLDGGAEAAGHVGVAGVGGVAVDVSLDTALADQHVPVAAGRTGPDGEVLLALAQDLAHHGVGLAVGRKAAEGDAVSVSRRISRPRRARCTLCS